MQTRTIAAVAVMILAALTVCADAGSYVFTTDQSPIVAGKQNVGFLMRPDADPYLGPADRKHGEIRVFTDWDSSVEARSYLTFDLSSLVVSVASATIKIHQAGTYVDAGWGFELEFYSVETDAHGLSNLTEFDWDIFEDLGGGTLYRKVEMLDAQIFEGTQPPNSILFQSQEGSRVFEISLNPDAIADINHARGSYFSIGIRSAGPGGAFWGAEEYGPPQLVLSARPIPLPPAVLSGGTMLLGILGYMRWRPFHRVKS